MNSQMCRGNAVIALRAAVYVGLVIATLPFQYSYAEEAQTSAGESAKAVTQGKEGQLQEIVVTANRRAQNVQSVPIAISAVSGTALTNSGVSSVQDLAMRLPSISFQSAGTGLQPYIRGIGTTAQGVGNEQSVATYVDGVFIRNPTGLVLPIEDIKEVEVDKGPQGTLFGRNATGGVIAIHTLTPSQAFQGVASVTYGNYQTTRAELYVTGGLGNTVAANLAVSYHNQSEGYGRNLFTGYELKNRDYSLRSKWLLTPTDVDTITLGVDLSYVNSPGNYNVSLVPGSVSNWGAGATTAAQRPDQAPYIASGAVAPFAVVGEPTTRVGGPWDSNSSENPESNVQSSGVNLQWQHNFGVARLTNITAKRWYRNQLDWSANPVPAPVQQAGYRDDEPYWTEELRLESSTHSAIQWVVGAFYLDQLVSYPVGSGEFYVRGTSIVPLTKLAFHASQTTRSEAGFGQATAPIPGLPGTHITAGVRYTSETKRMIGDIAVSLPELPQPIVSDKIDANTTFNKTTFRLILDHQLTDNVLIYASYNTGFKSGGYNMIPPGGKAFRPENLDTYEVGEKSELFDRRVRFNAAAFYYNWSDMQVTVYNNTTAITENAARARLYGLDLDMEALITDRLRVSWSATALKDYFAQYQGAQFNIPVPLSGGGGTLGISGNAAGHDLPYAPNITSSVSVDYNVPIADGAFGFNTTYYYKSRWFYGADNILGQGGYGVVNMSVHWTTPDGKTTVGLWGDNLSNKEYATMFSVGTNPGGYEQMMLGAPRTYGITVRREF